MGFDPRECFMTPFVTHESAGAPARKTRQGYSSLARTSGSSAPDARPCHGTNPIVTIVMMIPFSGVPRMPTRRSRVPRSEKALVRAVARVGEGSPAKCGSAQESEADRVYAPSEAQARERFSVADACRIRVSRRHHDHVCRTKASV